MKILVIFTFGNSLQTWKRSGILERELAMYKKMTEAGHEVGLLTYGDHSDFDVANSVGSCKIIPVYTYVKRPANKFVWYLLSLALPFKLSAIFKEYDVYKTNQMFGSWVAVIARLLYRKKLVVRCGYEWLKNSLRQTHGLKRIGIAVAGYILEAASYTFCHAISVTAEPVERFIEKYFPWCVSKIERVPNAIDVDLFRPLKPVEYHDNRAVYVGRLSTEKNLINLFWALVNSQRAIGLDVIGEDGGQADELKRFVAAHGLDVRFFGVVSNSELPKVLNRYPVFVLVSQFENAPKALLEAMACERVVIGSNCEGINDIIRDSVSGMLVSPDEEGIREGLERAFDLTVREQEAFGRHARTFVEEHHSLAIVFEKEMRLYND